MSKPTNRTARMNLTARKKAAAGQKRALEQGNPASRKARIAKVIDGLNATSLHTEERGQLFYSKELLDTRNENVDSRLDFTVIAHYFGMGCDWFVTEFDAKTGIAWGFACLQDPDNAEWGSFGLSWIEEMGFNVPMEFETENGLIQLGGQVRIERNQYWVQRTVAELKANGQYSLTLANA